MSKETAKEKIKHDGEIHLQWEVLPDVLRQGLMLPPEFEIIDVNANFSAMQGFGEIIVRVRSACIPAHRRGEVRNPLLPYYVIEDGKPFLDRIETTGYSTIDELGKVTYKDGTVLYKREEAPHA